MRRFPYVPDNAIATGQHKAARRIRGGDMRTWWKAILTQNGWVTALEAFSLPPAGRPVVARVNHGRWVAHCECGGAEIVDPKDPVFMCLSCANSDHQVGGRFRLRPISFPIDRSDIEEALLFRPDPSKRNWTAGETLERLRQENRDHGLPDRKPEEVRDGLG